LVFGMSLVFRVSQVFDFFRRLKEVMPWKIRKNLQCPDFSGGRFN